MATPNGFICGLAGSWRWPQLNVERPIGRPQSRLGRARRCTAPMKPDRRQCRRHGSVVPHRARARGGPRAPLPRHARHRRLDIKADGVDGTVGAEESRSDRSLVMDISFRRLRPRIRSGCRPNPPGVARCYPHLESVVEQMSDDPAAEKTGSAEHRYQSAMAGCIVCKIIFRHGQQPARHRHDLSLLRKDRAAASQDAPASLLVNGHSEFERSDLLAKGAVSVGSSVSKASMNCGTILRKYWSCGLNHKGRKARVNRFSSRHCKRVR
jgi:hypothetical protein